MKKFLLVVLSFLMTIPMMAEGTGSGDTKLNAIEFSLEDNGKDQAAGTKWYRVDLAPLYEEDHPQLALYLTNLDNADVDVTIEASLLDEEESRSYTIEPGKNKVWSVSASGLVQMNEKEIYLTLKSSGKVHLSAKVYEAQDIDDACLKSVDFNWAGTNQNAGEQWYKIDLSDVRSQKNKEVKLVAENLGSAKATVVGGVSTDCPSSGLTNYTLSVGVGEQKAKVISRATIDALANDLIFVKVKTDQSVLLSAELVDAPDTVIYDGTSATELFLNHEYTLTDGAIYKFALDSVRVKKMVPEITFTNEGSASSVLTGDMSYTMIAKSVITKSLTIGGNAQVVKAVEKNMIDGIADSIKYVYFRIKATNGPVKIYARLKNVHEGNACAKSVLFDWENGNLQEGSTTQWYKVGIGAAKEDKKDIKLYVYNRTSADATVKADVAFDCPFDSLDLQSFTRTVAANDTAKKTLAWASFGAIASDTIYVCVTTTKSIKLMADTAANTAAPDAACLTAIPFDPVQGAKQEANTEVWYAVGIADMQKDLTNLPFVWIRNDGTAKANVEGAMAIDCPATSTTDRTMSVAAGDTYEKQISRDMLAQLTTENDTIYIRVKTDQAIAIGLRYAVPDAGSSCTAAIDFNWSVGNDQLAGDNLWYRVVLTDAKAATGKDIKLTVVNKSSNSNTLEAAIAPNCPCETPQMQSGTIDGNVTKTKLIHQSMLETFGDTIYIRLSSSEDVHFEAELVDAEPFDTINCADLTLVNFEFGHLYTQTANDTVWYIADKAFLSQLDSTKTTKTPFVQLFNGANTNTVTAELAYHCPITTAMTSKVTTVGASETVTKLIERSMTQQFAEKDTMLVCVIGTNEFSFQVDTVDPNQGQDCAHAVQLSCPDNKTQYAVTSAKTIWYSLDAKTLAALNKKIYFSIENQGSAADEINAALYTSCEAEVLQEKSFTLSAGAKKEKGFNSDVFMSFNSDKLYLALTAKQQLNIIVRVEDLDPITPIDVCGKATAVLPNVWYTQSENEVWYKVNLKDLRINTKGDGELVVTNLSGVELTTQAELAWSCQISQEMTTTQRTIAADGTITKTVGRQTIDATAQDSAFIRVTKMAGDSLKFILNIDWAKGTCDNPILFDWDNGNDHPAGDTLWYVVNFDEGNRVPVGKNLRLHIDNLEAPQSADVYAALFTDCDTYLGKKSYSNLTDTVSRLFLRDTLATMGWTPIEIKYTSTRNTHIWAELEDQMDTIFTYDSVYYAYAQVDTAVCAGAVITTNGVDHIINADATWTDSILVQQDSIVEKVEGALTYMTIRDSIDVYPYSVKLFDTFVIQANADFSTLKAVCGKGFPELTGDTTALRAALVSGTATYPQDALILVEQDTVFAEDQTVSPAVRYAESLKLSIVVKNADGCWISEMDTVLKIEDPTPENDSTMSEMPYLVNKFGNWLLLINVNQIRADLGWDVVATDVTWYKQSGAIPAPETDTNLGNGLYYTEKQTLDGSYYAVIKHTKAAIDECSGEGITNVFATAAPAPAPSLRPSLVNAGEDIVIEHLDPLTETLVRVFNVQGEVVNTYRSSDAESFIIKAADNVGYYMVDLQSDDTKVTLRYIVK